MSGKEKLYFLLNRIDDVREISPSGQPLKVDPMNDLKGRYREVELSQLFTKLEKDEKVLKILKTSSRTKTLPDEIDPDPYDHADDGCWHIELLPAFDEYYLKIQKKSEYQKFTGKTPPSRGRKKFNRKSLGKIWDILQEIETKRGITSSQDDISIPQVHFSKVRKLSEADAYSDERLNILKKLKEESAIKDLRWPHDFHKLVYLKIGDRYFEVYDYYKKEYEKVADAYQKSRRDEQDGTNKPAYEITYSEQTREILINGFLLKKLRSFSENDAIFACLYKNPNEDKSDEDIKKGIGQKSIKDLNKFIDNIGFKGELRKVFFKVSRNKIRFNNPITKEYLKELGVEHLKLK